MKKNLYLATLAAMLLASCAEDEIVQQNDFEQRPIGFSTFVDQSTRAETTLSSLQNFQVWASKARNVEEETASTLDLVTILNGDQVSKSGSTWTYTPKKYWVKENAYSFTAIGSASNVAILKNYMKFALPSKVATKEFMSNYHGTITMDCKGANGEEDIVWASNKVATIHNSAPEIVNFNFNHLLSKVDFKFVNLRSGIESGNNVKIYDVQILNPANSGELNLNTISVGTDPKYFQWVPKSDQEYNLDFNFTGNTYYNLSNTDGYNSITSSCKYIIPTQNKIRVSFKVNTTLMAQNEYINIVKDIYFDTPANTNPTFEGIQLWPGYYYTFVAYIDNEFDNLGEIKLGVTAVNDYIPVQGPIYEIEAAEPLKLTEYSVNTTASIDITRIMKYTYKELVYLLPETGLPVDPETGEEIKPVTSEEIDYTQYSYEWNIENQNYLAVDNSSTTPSYTYILDQGTVDNAVALHLPVKVLKKPSSTTDIKISLTLKNSEGKVVAVKSTKITLAVTTTGGSQDGDDNDG